MKTKISKSKYNEIQTLLYGGFGAFGIVVSMNKGYITDHAIKIRDKVIADINKLLEN